MSSSTLPTDIPTRSRRSSTSRSVRSIYRPPPTWRSSSLVKSSAPVASVSMVFAEPEQGAPLASASSSAGVLVSSPPVSPAVVKEEVDERLGDVPEETTVRSGEDALNGSSFKYADLGSQPFPSNNLQSKASLPNLGSSTSVAPRRNRTASWFGSITRSKGKVAMRRLTADQEPQESPVEPTSVPLPKTPDFQLSPPPLPETQALPAPVVDAQPSEATYVQEIDVPLAYPVVEAVVAATSHPRPIPSPQRQPANKRSWFSSPASSPVSSPPAPRYYPSSPPSAYTLDPPPQILPAPMQESPDTSPSLETRPPMPPPPPPFAANLRTPSLPSSIDDRVPSLPPTPPAYLTPALQSPTYHSPPLGPTAALNPSSSRFTLSIPLLGRAKVPLGTVMGMAEGKKVEKETSGISNSSPKIEYSPESATTTHSSPNDSAKMNGTGSSDFPPIASTSTTVSVSTTTNTQVNTQSPDDDLVTESTLAKPIIILKDPFPTDSTLSEGIATLSPPLADSPHVVSATSLSSTTSRQNQHEQQSSWWDYVGWSSSSVNILTKVSEPTSGAASETTKEEEAKEETHKVPSNELVPPVADVSNPAASAPALLESASKPGDVAEPTHAIEEDVRLPSVEVDEGPTSTTENPDGTYSTWYAPLAWYYSSTTTTTAASNDKDGVKVAAVEEKQEEVDQAPGAEQEVQANAAPGATVRTPSPDLSNSALAQSQQSEQPAANPISDHFVSNKTGWASFFSSRMLIVKSLGYDSGVGAIEDVKRDENGMEVMEIDDDDDELPERGRGDDRKNVGGADQTVSTSTTSTTTTTMLVNTAPSLSSKTSSGSTASTEPRKNTVAPPLTISEDVRKETEKANAKLQTAASAVSTSSTPRKGNSGTSTPAPSSPSPSNPATPSSKTVATTKTAVTTSKRTASPAPSKKSVSAPPPPNLVLPTWQDTFYTQPRNILPPKPETYVDDQGVGGKLLGKTMKFVSGVLFAKDTSSAPGGTSTRSKGKERAREGSVLGAREREATTAGTESIFEKERMERFNSFGKELPKAWSVYEDAGWDTTASMLGGGFASRPSPPAMSRGTSSRKGTQPGETVIGQEEQAKAIKDVLRGCKRVVVIGVHGWFPGAMIRTVLGEPTGTSTKFANMMEQALQEFEGKHGVRLEKITKIPLEGDGTIEKRVEKLYTNLKANEEWMRDLHNADAILVATHSQGSIVSTHLLNRLIHDNHIITSRNQTVPMGTGAEAFPSAIGVGDTQKRKVQRVCCLALCGIHLGPLRYLSSSTLVGPYLQYFESTAALELFEFQNTESQVSKEYVKALQNVLDHGTKMLYIASLNDQVVPIYSGLFTAVSHPLILRALYIDGDAYHSSDFLSNLLVLLLRILNSGISDSGLLAHLSEATAGSLNGVGHSTAYEELATYSLAVKYLFLTNDGVVDNTQLMLEPFNANHEQNDYEIPWSLRDIIADERVAHFFSGEINELRDAFRDWHPKTTILRDLKRKLQPITRLPSTFSTITRPSKL